MLSAWLHRSRQLLWLVALTGLLVLVTVVRLAGWGTLNPLVSASASNPLAAVAMLVLAFLIWITTCRAHRSPHRWQKRAAWIWALGRCVYCHRHTPFRHSHGDHVVAWSHGWWGLTSIFNIVNACPTCNMSKSAKNMPRWMVDYAASHGGYYPHVPLRARYPWTPLHFPMWRRSRQVRRMYRRAHM